MGVFVGIAAAERLYRAPRLVVVGRGGAILPRGRGGERSVVRRTGPGRGSPIESAAIGTATLAVALLGYLLIPQLDDSLFIGMVAAVAAMIGMGTYLLGRSHSGFLGLGRAHTWTLWIPPVAWFVAGAALLRLAPFDSSTVPAAIGAALLGLILFAQHRELRLAAGSRRGAEFLVSLAVFVSAFALFGLLYQARDAGIVVALIAGGVAALLATVPLRRAIADDERTAIYCGVVGLIVGQVAWALTYWTTAGIVGGAFLLLLFYVLVGLSEAVLDRSFSRRVILEYGVVGACGLVLIVGVGPWHG
jgi:hypothetical protein